MKLYNTLTGKKETFKPLNATRGKPVKLFVCGPTVYDYAHLGHARTYVAFDIIAKYLKEKGHKVFYLQNITDIDDKIIQRAKEKNTTVKELAKFFEKEYLKDMKTLKVNSVTKYARATDHYKEILSQVKRLKNKGFAYETSDGIYYDISKFKNYGKLSGRTALQAEDAVSRIDESKEKRNKGDFCIWKFGKPDRPGWHIEDTAITEKYFGPQYDMHGGAKDLIFPHHEAEIAQMEAISGKSPMVKYWIHTGFLTVNGQKMSKSLGNFITIQDFSKKYSARVLRFLFAKSHYRSPMDYTESSVVQAKKELARIDEFVSGDRTSSKTNIRKYETDFEQAMDDDFNTPKAIACIFNLMKEQKIDAQETLKFLKKIDRVLGFIFWPQPKGKTPQEINTLVEEREKQRKNGNWQKADELRKKITALGWQVEDTKDGSKLKQL
ncbi:MAG: cysteine--tRNA ligase [Candidatus Paceibacterota bacterium]